MANPISTLDEYMDQLVEERIEPMTRLMEIINGSIPEGFQETINYNMPAWVVPHSRYPDGYHCDPKLPLPFLNLASQKRFIALYHMGIYADPKLHDWFVSEYPKHCKYKLDMGKAAFVLRKWKIFPIN